MDTNIPISVKPVEPPPDGLGENENKLNSKSTFFLIIIIIFTLFGAIYMGNLIMNNQRKGGIESVIPAEITQAINNLEITSSGAAVQALGGELLISGKTLPLSTVAVYSDIDDTIITADESGIFETTIVTDEEGGLIRITSYLPSGEESTKTVYLQNTGELSVLGKSEKSGSNNDENRKNEKKDEVKKNNVDTSPPEKNKDIIDDKNKAFLKDKNTSDKNKVITDKEYSKQEKLGAKELKRIFKEGTDSGKLEKVKLKKMLMTDATEGAVLKRHAVSGLIIAVSGDSITVSHLIHRERVYTVFYNTDTVITSSGVSSAMLSPGLRMTGVGEPVNTGGILAKRIHLIPGLAEGVFRKQPFESSSSSEEFKPTGI